MERFLLMIFPKFQLLELVSSTFHRYEGSPIKSYSNILWRISNDPSVICVEISAAPSVANFALPRMAKMTQFPSCKFRWHFEIRFWSFFTCTSSKRCIFFSYPFVFLEWNIYLILKNHIDRKHPTSPPLLAWIFSWMNGSKKNILLEKDLFDFTFSTFSTKKNPVSVLIFVCCVWSIPSVCNTKTENHGNIFANVHHQTLPTLQPLHFFFEKNPFPHLQWPSVSQVRDQCTWDPNLSRKSDCQRKKTARSKASSKLHRLKQPKFLDKENAIHLPCFDT